MRKVNQRSSISLCLITAVLFVGCQGQRKPTGRDLSERDVESSADASPKVKDRRIQIAVKAKEALFTALSGRLMEVLQADGPIAAISVCSREASTIAASVGKEHGVEIGRTSFKLRNPANAPRDWVKPLVEERVETTQSVLLENGNLGVLYPIHLNVKCLMCHGGPDDILDQVKTELAELYPNDAATGFKQGDLRGWFWVEVPPDAI